MVVLGSDRCTCHRLGVTLSSTSRRPSGVQPGTLSTPLRPQGVPRYTSGSSCKLFVGGPWVSCFVRTGTTTCTGRLGATLVVRRPSSKKGRRVHRPGWVPLVRRDSEVYPVGRRRLEGRRFRREHSESGKDRRGPETRVSRVGTPHHGGHARPNSESCST